MKSRDTTGKGPQAGSIPSTIQLRVFKIAKRMVSTSEAADRMAGERIEARKGLVGCL